MPVGVGDGSKVGICVPVGVGDGVAVTVAVDVDVVVGVTVGVAVGWTNWNSNAPISHSVCDDPPAPFWLRGKPR